MEDHEIPILEAPPPALVPVPDLAGTPAADADGTFFGEVYGALADAESGLIRYLDLDVRAAGRHVLVPVGHARVSRTGEKPAGIRLRAVTAGDLASIPAWQPSRALTGDVPEDAILEAYGQLFRGEKYYAHPAYDHAGLYAGDHPVMRRGAEERAARADAGMLPAHLARLTDLREFEVSEEQPDIRGWLLLTSGEREAGHVADLLVDPAALEVRYAVVRRSDGHEVLLPVGFLAIDAEHSAVRAPALNWEDVQALPAQKGPVTRGDEDAVRRALDGALTGARRFQRPDFRAIR